MEDEEALCENKAGGENRAKTRVNRKETMTMSGAQKVTLGQAAGFVSDDDSLTGSGG